MPLTVFFGPMYAKKSSYLIDALNYDADQGFSVIYVNSVKDTREYLTHCKRKFLSEKIQKHYIADLSLLPLDTIKANPSMCSIGVDEAQFFASLDQVVVWKDLGVNVYVAGLVGKFDRTPFGHIKDIIQHATEIHKLHATCQRCLEIKKKKVNAEHSYKKPEVTVNSEGIAVGGVESYFPVCNECYLALNAVAV